MHPEVKKLVERYEAEARRKRWIRRTVGYSEILFLETVLGPALNYNFEGLHIEYPFLDAKGGQRFVDFYFERGEIRIVFEIDGFTTHARNITPSEFDDHLDRQNDLLEMGWHLLRFSTTRIELDPHFCRERVKKAIGFAWTRSNRHASDLRGELWRQRFLQCQELALKSKGPLKPREVGRAFDVSTKTAREWLQRFSKEGYFRQVKKTQRVVGYQLYSATNEDS